MRNSALCSPSLSTWKLCKTPPVTMPQYTILAGIFLLARLIQLIQRVTNHFSIWPEPLGDYTNNSDIKREFSREADIRGRSSNSFHLMLVLIPINKQRESRLKLYAL